LSHIRWTLPRQPNPTPHAAIRAVMPRGVTGEAMSELAGDRIRSPMPTASRDVVGVLRADMWHCAEHVGKESFVVG